MSRSTGNVLFVGGSTLAGGVAGMWATSKLALNYGCQLGPWGVAIGAVLGALLGAAATSGPQDPAKSRPGNGNF